ncbi:type II toxin-antitoxin system RelB/DinJ family antitoxin [Rickettsia australis]|uniref:DNA-damage-inducible protein J n=1 Tax=Rickettsia australis (strain Cutlack) TaxID=1105110 RepID=H8K792_RICAC|nr:type II toxin-antitoxin system RelB/DinJ family antitoxin [Rickettsia australis]AFC71135.1 DNA-damage-inducible protein J [Rickettsia australis str. Cutlack]
MENTVDIRIRVSADIKIEAEEIFKQMGMTMSEAMRIFLNQCINSGGLPFKPHIKIPNKETLESFKQAENGEFESYNLNNLKNF